MSSAQGNTEIVDVLASIRRLVAEDRGAPSIAPAAAPEPAPAPRGPLLLQPAQRADAPAPGATPLRLTPRLHLAPEAPEAPRPFLLTPALRVFPGGKPEQAPEVPEAAFWPEAEETEVAADEGHPLTAEAVEELLETSGDLPWLPPESRDEAPVASSGHQALFATLTRLEREGDAFEDTAALRALLAEDEEPESDVKAWAEDAAGEASAPEPVEEAPLIEAEDLGMAQPQPDLDWELDETPAAALAEEQPVQRSPVIHRAQAEEWSDAVAERPPAAQSDLLAALEELFEDDEAASELIGRLIRRELQGDLGERMTRQIRKLVHREVERHITLRRTES